MTEKLQQLLQNDAVVYAATQIFDALSDFTRFQILKVKNSLHCTNNF